MRRRGAALGLVVATVLNLGLPVTASSDVQKTRLVNPVVGRRLPIASYIAGGFSVPDALRLHLVNELVAAGIPKDQVGLRVVAPQGPCLGSSHSTVEVPVGDVEAADDLNGDQRPDVVEVHSTMLDAKRRTWVGSARDARTGRVLWQRRLVLDGQQAAFLLAARVGQPGRAGLLFVHYRFMTERPGLSETSTVTVSFEGLDGRGRTAWRRSLTGSYRGSVGSSTASFRDYPDSVDLGHLRPGTDDLIVTRYTTEASATTARFERIAVATGALTHPYPEVSSSAASSPLGQVGDLVFGRASFPLLRIVPDQNGDRRPDLAVTRVSGGSDVQVFRGDTGAPVWRSLPLPLEGYADVYDAGVLTQGETRVHDLAVVTGLTQVVIGQDVLGDNDRLSGLVLLLRGGSGSLAWALPGSGVFTMQRYRGTPAIGLTSSDTGFPPVLSTEGRHVEVDVVDGTGLVRARNRYPLRQSLIACDGALVVIANSADVNGDGSTEARIDYAQFNPVGTAETWLTVDGASGGERDRSDALDLGGSVDGRNPDRASVRPRGSVMRFIVVRGDKPSQVLLSGELPWTGQHRFWGNAHAVAAASLTCQDVEMVSVTSDASTTRLVASNGGTWWTLSATSDHPEGTLSRGGGARPRC